MYTVPLEVGEQVTCGAFGPCGKNIGIGTSFGKIFMC